MEAKQIRMKGQVMKAIQTRYHGPTDTKGSRISAFDNDGNRIYLPYDHGSADPHRDAAIAFARKMEWTPLTLCGGWVKDGRVFTIVNSSSIFDVKE